jgi:ferredoxin
VPVWIIPGHARDAITLTVGYGRTRAGALGNGTGFNTYQLRGSNALFFGAATVTKDGGSYELANTQDHWSLEHTNILRSATRDDFKANPAFVKEMEHGPAKSGVRISLYPDREYRGQQWGMAIDLNTCTGCSACVIACVAENNIPVVGKAQVKRNREMHWLRIDRYFAGPDPDAPDRAKWSARCRRPCTAPKA